MHMRRQKASAIILNPNEKEKNKGENSRTSRDECNLEEQLILKNIANEETNYKCQDVFLGKKSII